MKNIEKIKSLLVRIEDALTRDLKKEDYALVVESAFGLAETRIHTESIKVKSFKDLGYIDEKVEWEKCLNAFLALIDKLKRDEKLTFVFDHKSKKGLCFPVPSDHKEFKRPSKEKPSVRLRYLISLNRELDPDEKSELVNWCANMNGRTEDGIEAGLSDVFQK
jgi:hypothetical protein